MRRARLLLGWAITWSCYLLGAAVSELMMRFDWGWLYRAYSGLMRRSSHADIRNWVWRPIRSRQPLSRIDVMDQFFWHGVRASAQDHRPLLVMDGWLDGV